MAVSFVWDFLARIWTPVAASRPLSLFAYYRPQEMVASGAGARDLITLASVGVAGMLAALIIFRRRDL